MSWIFLLIGLAAGAVIAWAVTRAQSRAALETVRTEVTAANRDALGIVGKEIEDKNTEIGKLRALYDAERVARAGLESTLRETERRLEEQRQFVENSKKQLEDTFKALSKDALDSNTRSFLERADAAVKPLDEALKTYQEQARALERSLKTDYGSLDQQLRTVATTTDSLKRETANLGTALRNPQVRGRWGELTLRRVAELSGMSDHCDFTEQVTVDSEEGRMRPDMVVNLPGGRQIIVDSKVSLDAYIQAVSATGEEERAVLLKRHASQVKEHVRRLSGKAYWSQFDPVPDYVVMFIPGESFFAAAADVDHALIEDAMRSNVILASPTTFMALLRTVALGWRQEQIARNADTIRKLGADLHERINRFVAHFAGIGRALDQAMGSYDKAASTLESRVLVSARRFKELGATAQPDISEVPAIGHLTRSVQADLLTADSDNDG